MSDITRWGDSSDGNASMHKTLEFCIERESLLQVPKVTKIPIQPDVMDLRVPTVWSKTDNGGDGSFLA